MDDYQLHAVLNSEDRDQYTDLSFLDKLNEAQREAVLAIEGSSLILAGAGTGKTSVLISRLAYLIAQRAATLDQILAVTFTNKAANEMRQRTERLLGHALPQLWLGTFHSMAHRILQRHAELVGLQPQYVILDDSDQLLILKALFKQEGVEDVAEQAKGLRQNIQRWKDKAWTQEEILAAYPDEKLKVRIYQAYQERLKALNAVDFGDILLYNVRLFEQYPDVLAQYAQRFKYILVDEYQDTNSCQYLWLRHLASVHKNISCVGDDDQSIYGWRGAEVENMLRFRQDFSGTKLFRLEQNYRSTGYILQAASDVIANNSQRIGKELWTEADLGHQVQVHHLLSGKDEAQRVCELIQAYIQAGYSYGDMAILMRSTYLLRLQEERLIYQGYPYEVVGGSRFYERKEVKDAIAYLRIVFRPQDDLALERIINVPKRGIGPKTLQMGAIAAQELGVSLEKTYRQLTQTEDLGKAARTKLVQFLNLVSEWREQTDKYSLSDLMRRILDESGYTMQLRLDKQADAPGRLENLKEFCTSLEGFEDAQDFFEHLSLLTERAASKNQAGVSLMTLHAAKGLEFPIVFIIGCEEGTFPSARSQQESGIKGLEEERRLAYVGITRGKRRVHMLFTDYRDVHRGYQLPSRFLKEIRSEAVVFHDERAYGSDNNYYQRQRYSQSQMKNSPSPQPQLSQEGGLIFAGAKVQHATFGYGWVLSFDGMIVKVRFESGSEKNVMKSFLTLC